MSLRQRDIPNFDILIGPLVEELDASNLLSDLLWKDLVARDGLDLDFFVVRHDGELAMLTSVLQIGGSTSKLFDLRLMFRKSRFVCEELDSERKGGVLKFECAHVIE